METVIFLLVLAALAVVAWLFSEFRLKAGWRIVFGGCAILAVTRLCTTVTSYGGYEIQQQQIQSMKSILLELDYAIDLNKVNIVQPILRKHLAHSSWSVDPSYNLSATKTLRDLNNEIDAVLKEKAPAAEH